MQHWNQCNEEGKKNDEEMAKKKVYHERIRNGSVFEAILKKT